MQKELEEMPVCSPARSSLMLGSYPSKTSMKANLYQSGCSNLSYTGK
ncbi:MAG: hypothetical protein ACLTBU_10235 [Zhenhengia sp.]|nr:hypothetical protein [Niameybacter sp.]